MSEATCECGERMSEVVRMTHDEHMALHRGDIVAERNRTGYLDVYGNDVDVWDEGEQIAFDLAAAAEAAAERHAERA